MKIDESGDGDFRKCFFFSMENRNGMRKSQRFGLFGQGVWE